MRVQTSVRHNAEMTNYIFQGWGKRNGASRVYINDADTQQTYGYYDLHANHLVSQHPAAEEGMSILAQMIGEHQQPTAADFEEPAPATRDLAKNVPGATINSLQGTSYKAGLVGEQRTALELLPLAPEWRVLHSVPLTPTKDIDHLLIGPGGVIAVNTKVTDYPVEYRNDAVYVGGYRKDWRESQLHATTQASLKLQEATGMDVPVQSLVVVWSPIPSQGPDWIVDGSDLCAHVERLPALRSESWVAYVHDTARRADTW